MDKKVTRSKWFNGTATGILASSVIILFWLPLLFVMPPGADYRPMCSAPLSFMIIVACMIYAFVLGMMGVSHSSDRKIKIVAIMFNMLPLILCVVIVLILMSRGNFWSP
jgi:hypothetical protein